MSQSMNTVHATASPASDALCASPEARVSSEKLSGFISAKTPIYFGCWNVRTLLDIGSQAITAKSLYDYQIEVACLSEVRLPGTGSTKIKVPSAESTYLMHHSGPVDGSGQHGVAILLGPTAQRAMLAWNPVSPRIATVRLRGKPFNITVVAVYAPTLAADSDVKDEFYDQLQETINGISRGDILFVAGDWNARTGPSDSSTRHILGKFGLGERCENGARLISFADVNHMCVTNTRFQHPRKHLLTWYSNDGHTANQIDYILVRSRWMSSVEDCRSYRGAETGNRGGSDHTLVRAKLRLHLKSRRRRQPTRRLNVATLADPSRCTALSASITAKLTSADGGTHAVDKTNVEHQWNNLKLSTQQAALETLGTIKSHHKDWISERTIRASQKARDARLNNAPNYRHLRRETTRSARADRKQYWDEMASAMESAANVGDFGGLFRLIRKASGKRNAETILRSATGDLISDVNGKIARWVEHFSQLLNRPYNGRYPPQPPATSTPSYDVDCSPPTEVEITTTIQRMKNKKSPGEDGIPAEIYKACIGTLLPSIHRLFSSIWEQEACPSDFGMSILLPFPKKGDRSRCENYRGISLLNTASKLFASILLKRFSHERHARTRPNQGGFRPGKGCVDQIFTLRRVLEHRNEFQQPTVACFIDFRAAFDSVDRDSLWNIMLLDGMPIKLVNLIKAYYAATKARVRVYGEESDEFSLHTGVRQGCPLSPILFNYAVDWILSNALAGFRGVQVSNDLWLTDVDYADDVVLLADSFGSMQTVLDQVAQFSSAVGLEINADKTKAFAIGVSSSDEQLTVYDSPIETVDDFTYLGSKILPTGQAKNEVRTRIDRARLAFLQLKNSLWRRSEISLKTKIRVYQATVRPVLLYGCETWPLRSEDSKKLEVFDHWCLRYITKTKWMDRVSNASVRHQCGDIMQLSVWIQHRRLQWFGHVLRKPEDELVRQVMNPGQCANWRRRRGGQLKTWLATIKSDVELLGLRNVYGPRHWERHWPTLCSEMAANRPAWRGIIRDINGAGLSSKRSQPQ